MSEFIPKDKCGSAVDSKKCYPLQIHFRDIRFSIRRKKKSKQSFWQTLTKFKKEDKKKKEDKEKEKKKAKKKREKMEMKDKTKAKKPSGEWITILDGITGTLQPGTLTAIMGPSGAGKTTLLNLLAGRVQGKVEGEILFNGIPKEAAGKEILNKIAYVLQDDVFLASQTPREILQFTSNLKLPKTITKEQKEKSIDQLLAQLNLLHAQNTRVGAPGVQRGVSGGERKRTSIAVALITQPSLIFLDEPTSGLDSSTSMKVINGLKALTQLGHTIACTIHQPSSEIFHKFDNFILLAKGKLVYQGPVLAAVEYFAEAGYEVPPLTNPADYFMYLVDADPSEPESVQRVKHLIDLYQKSECYKKLKDVEILSVPPPEPTGYGGYERHTFVQFYYLMKRNLVDVSRNPLRTRILLGQTLFLAFLIGLSYLRLPYVVSAIQGRLGAMFFVLTNQTFTAVTSIVNTFPSEKAVFLREYSARTYNVPAYYLGKVISDLPYQIFFPLLFTTIVYWLIGFKPTAADFFQFALIIVLLALVGGAWGLFISVVSPTATVAIVLVPVTLLPFMIFSGFLIIHAPVYFIWIPYISFIRWGFFGIVNQQFRGLRFECSEDSPPDCEPQTGEQVLDNFNLRSPNFTSLDPPWVTVLILASMWLLIHCLSLFTLSRRAKSAVVNA